ncbi:hypothetical protein KNP414_06539 [Paenibacillus mucilaginosus KNP414]|uniref:Uncharacterized protein n=1 Tax=Paenibacillus mucilaginosus (strain KNP414) TaxID=1036673 RepID=F8FNZ1_PAEMK|nr:hypothetical protein KNP414_06539 [Paenibacillus mucilaginosus KNP414]
MLHLPFSLCSSCGRLMDGCPETGEKWVRAEGCRMGRLRRPFCRDGTNALSPRAELHKMKK